MNPILQRVLRGATALAVVYHVLWACAPVASLPPPIPNAKGELTVGGAGVVGAHDLSAQTTSIEALHGHANVQGFAGVALNDRWNVYGTAFLGSASGVGVGVGARVDVVETERLLLGVQASGGLLYASVGLPMAVNVTDQLTLYTQPGVGSVTSPRSAYTDWRVIPQVPVGLWWTSPSGVGVGAELGAQGQLAPSGASSAGYGQLAPYLALNVGFTGVPAKRRAVP